MVRYLLSMRCRESEVREPANEEAMFTRVGEA